MTLGTGTSRNKTTYYYYKCTTCAKQGKTACKGRSIRMDKLDTLVTQHLIQRLLTTERLTETIASIVAQRATKVAEVDGRLQTLQTEISEAESKLKRLYQMVEEGLTDLDEILKGRIDALKQQRERAQTALDRIRVNAAPPTDIPAEIIETFGRMMRENITSGEIPFRKAYLRSVVDRIEVDDDVIRVIGSKATLMKAMAGGNPGLPGVQSFERKWCARLDSNQRPLSS
jgi:site-specific DNA recombinase